MFHPLEDRGDLGLFFSDHASCNDRLQRAIIAVNTWWQPERDPNTAAGALRCSCFKRASPEGSEQSRDVRQIVMRVIIHPARYRIGGKRQNQRGDGMVDFGVAGNGRDARWLHIHDDIPVHCVLIKPVVGRMPGANLRHCRPPAHSTVTINLLKPRRTLFSMRSSSAMRMRFTRRASAVNRARISSLARFWPRHMCGPAPKAM
jgi:hypothetical protein